MTAIRQVVLVGTGHAHIEVLRQWALRPPARAELTLIVDQNPAIYSGMVPGVIAGQYSPNEVEIDGVLLAEHAGARVIHQRAVSINAKQKFIRTVEGQETPYDLASLDVGSTVLGSALPGVQEHALVARPIQHLIEGTDELVERARSRSRDEPFHLLVVGAGAAGVELGFCFEERLRRDTGRPVEVTIIDAGVAPLAGAVPQLVKRVVRRFDRRGIRFLGNSRVTSVEVTGVRLNDDHFIDADAVVWVPGPAAHLFLADSDLPLDEGGFVRTGPTLQVSGAPELFAVGDCASLEGMKKAGVYAVRAGPVLAENMRRALSGESLETYEPQSDFLSLLNLGDGTALGVMHRFTFEGRWVMKLKDWIDRSFMDRY